MQAGRLVRDLCHRNYLGNPLYLCRYQPIERRQACPFELPYSASPLGYRRPSNQNFPAHPKAAKTLRNPAPYGPMHHRSHCRREGGIYPSRLPPDEQICDRICHACCRSRSWRREYAGAPVSVRRAGPEWRVIRSHSSHSQDRMSSSRR